MNTVIDQPQFAIHVFAREAEFVLFRHVAFRRDQTSVRPVFIQGAASARFPEEGGDVFHRVVHAVEMLFLLRPVRSRRVMDRTRVASGSEGSQM